MVKSPCNNICKIDGDSGLCVGCYRTLNEIRSWNLLSTKDKYWVLDDIALVRTQVYKFKLD